MTSTLDVYIGGDLAGWLRSHRGVVEFEYAEDYAADYSTAPLSLSMPKAIALHRGDIPAHWITNLLPDDQRKRNELAAQYDVAPNSPFELVGAVGHDVAGAVQLVPSGADPRTDGERIEKSEAEMASAVRTLRADVAATVSRFGRWSLAGFQSKLAVAIEDGRYFAPSGAAPSTHILKFGPAGVEHGDIAEYVTLRAAHYLGIPVAPVQLIRFEDQLAVAVERYDREWVEGEVRRVHQEDLCQAMGFPSALKYQSDGGPGSTRIAEFLRTLPMPGKQVEAFAQQLVFNALTYSPDAHAKNYSILLSGTAIGLAPAYDLTSLIPVTGIKELRHKVTTAMKTGSAKNYDADGFTPRRVLRLAQDVGVEGEWLLQTTTEIAHSLRAAFFLALNDAEEMVGERIVTLMRERAFAIADVLEARFPMN